MLGLLSPLWLAGLGALAVPVALHLWSRRGGRPIRVGSIRLLSGSPPATRRRWTIQDPWLLSLRCAVLAALVLALAGPSWVPRTRGTHVQALVARDIMGREVLIDSLHRAGLPVASLDSVSSVTPNFWAALRRADRTAEPGTQLVVFAPDLLRYFRGVRPALRSRVEWHSRPAAAQTAPARPAPAARLVFIFADPSRLDDARYVSAALGAAGEATGIPAVVSLRPTMAASVGDGGPAAWIFWLSDQPIPSSIRQHVRQGGVLLSDAGMPAAARFHSRIVTGSEPTDAWLTRTVSGPAIGAPIWSDGTGSPLLTVALEGRGLAYRFNSRFVPAWSDFVLRPAFPLAIARLWATGSVSNAAADHRRITVQQLTPDLDPEAPPAPSNARRSLFLPVWVLAMLLFLAERWMSRRPRVTA